jgi:Uma2 family endonuclease
MVTQALKRLYTIEEFMALEEPDNGSRLELVDGEIEVMPPGGEFHSDVEGNIQDYLRRFVKERGLGKVYTSDAGFILRPKTVRAPDTAFISIERRDPNLRVDGAVPIPPDLAVEVVSPSDRAGKIKKKVNEYLEAGVKLVWVIYPKRKEVHVYRLDGDDKEVLNINDELSGENVVKDFKVKVSKLFE